MVSRPFEDLRAWVEALKAEGGDVLDKIDDFEHCKFAWVIDSEGNKIGSRQPPDVQ